MAVPSILPLMMLAFFSSFKCCETVGCAKGNSFTISPQIQVSTDNKYSTIAILAGCPSAFAKEAINALSNGGEVDIDKEILYLINICCRNTLLVYLPDTLVVIYKLNMN